MKILKPYVVITESESGDVRFVGIVEDVVNNKFHARFSITPYGNGEAPWQGEHKEQVLIGQTSETKNFYKSWEDATQEILADCGDEFPENTWFDSIEEAALYFA